VIAVFFKFMVLPLFNLWHKFLDTRLSHSMMENLRNNQRHWEDLHQMETSSSEEQLTDATAHGTEEDAPESPAAADAPHGRRGSLPAVVLETVDKMGRRHSVPLNMARATAQAPCATALLRRDSVGANSTLLVQAENRRRFTLGQIPYLEEEEEGLSVSLGSSRSSGLQRSSDGGGGSGHNDDRPVSAENLIPEPSIATMTNTAEASRLCNVIHGASTVTSPAHHQHQQHQQQQQQQQQQQAASRSLTRQQTFPPIQPYVRARYLSTGGGGGGGGGSGSDPVAPGSSSSSGGGTSATSAASSRTGSTSSESCGNGTKRDSALDADRAFKLARFSKEKENVDPASRTSAEIRRNSNHVNQVRCRTGGRVFFKRKRSSRPLLDTPPIFAYNFWFFEFRGAKRQRWDV